MATRSLPRKRLQSMSDSRLHISQVLFLRYLPRFWLVILGSRDVMLSTKEIFVYIKFIVFFVFCLSVQPETFIHIVELSTSDGLNSLMM